MYKLVFTLSETFARRLHEAMFTPTAGCRARAHTSASGQSRPRPWPSAAIWRACGAILGLSPEPGLSELSELSEVCRSLSEVCRRSVGGQLSELCRSFVGRLSALSEHLGQFLSSSYVGLSELCRNCRTVGLSDCQTSVGPLSVGCRAPVGPLSYHLLDPSPLSHTTASSSWRRPPSCCPSC